MTVLRKTGLVLTCSVLLGLAFVLLNDHTRPGTRVDRTPSVMPQVAGLYADHSEHPQLVREPSTNDVSDSSSLKRQVLEKPTTFAVDPHHDGAVLERWANRNPRIDNTAHGATTRTGACLQEADVGANVRDWEELDFRRAVFHRADLRCADLAGANFAGTALRRADFRGANLTGADFHGADLRFADFTEAMLQGAVLTQADLHGADFTDAVLLDADLSETSAIELNMTGADMRHVRFRCVDCGARSAVPTRRSMCGGGIWALLALRLQ